MTTITKAGRYELREELGRGAMGVVFHGHDPVIGRDVAVKTMHLSAEGTGMSREELVGRFQTEARAAGLLAHPNIVVIYDAGEEEGLFYITMEMVEGRSLQTMLDARQLFPLPRVIKLMEQVCSALDFAHQHNVVHRDIKPANLVLTADDTVKITDFGTAKILQFGTAQTAHVMGTPSYMSPEQVKGKPVDGRSDIFSLGVILYELMTGEKPFPGQNITTVIYKIINEEPVSPRLLDSSIHPGLSTVITRTLAKDPDARYQNCHELLDALKNYRELVAPEATVRMAPHQLAPVGARPSAAQTRPASAPSNVRPHEAETPVQVISPATIAQEESSKTRGRVFLTVILLAIISFAGYRIYPAMTDLWQRAHEPVEKPIVPSKSSSATPAADSDTPDTGTQSAAPALTTAPITAEPSAPQQVSQPASQQTAPQPSQQSSVPVPPAKSPAPDVPPALADAEKSAAPARPAAPVSSPAANAAQIRLQSELAALSLTDKVKVQINSNTLTLSGRVNSAEHRVLLNQLHWLPAGVRVIDDLGYTDDPKETAGSVSTGLVWVRSEPQGAEILLDGKVTGLRTPARLELQSGQHEVRLVLGGFLPSVRTILSQPGQTMQFTDTLARQ